MYCRAVRQKVVGWVEENKEQQTLILKKRAENLCAQKKVLNVTSEIKRVQTKQKIQGSAEVRRVFCALCWQECRATLQKGLSRINHLYYNSSCILRNERIGYSLWSHKPKIRRRTVLTFKMCSPFQREFLPRSLHSNWKISWKPRDRYCRHYWFCKSGGKVRIKL